MTKLWYRYLLESVADSEGLECDYVVFVEGIAFRFHVFGGVLTATDEVDPQYHEADIRYRIEEVKLGIQMSSQIQTKASTSNSMKMA